MTNNDPEVLYQNPFLMTPEEFKAWWSRLDATSAPEHLTPPDIIYLGSPSEVADTDC